MPPDSVRPNLFQEVTVMKEKEQPFFARYLEPQDFPRVKTNLKGGPVTLKFPSDKDEAVTLKFPSDAEDAG